MTDFKDNMLATLNEFKQTGDMSTTAKKSGKSVTTYDIEVSGIDMIVSRNVNGKNTMKLYICLSQLDENGKGTMFIKSLREGTLRDATVDNVTVFLREMDGSVETGSNAIPTLESGKKFASRLLQAREKDYIDLIKEGIFNTDLLDQDNYSSPWFAPDTSRYYQVGMGINNKHSKLLRHMFEALANKYDLKYYQVLNKSCTRSSWRNDYDNGFNYVWAFSMLADIFDEPFAQKCFDEYIDNDRLEGLTASGLEQFFSKITERDRYYGSSWQTTVTNYKAGKAIVQLEKNRLWQFIQQAVGVGMGKKITQYLSLYSDYLTQANACDGRIREKYPEHLQVAHDIYSEKYELIREFREKEQLKKRVDLGRPLINQTHGEYQLRVLEDINQFLEEAQQNCNCVASYVERVKNGYCWIASFRKIGADTTQLTIEINPSGQMVQIKGKYNRDATDEENELLKEFQATILKRMEE